jgi:hypothetical protein
MLLLFHIIFITNYSWVYAWWQCYINNEQYVNSNIVVQNTECVTVIQNMCTSRHTSMCYYAALNTEDNNNEYRKSEDGITSPFQDTVVYLLMV